MNGFILIIILFTLQANGIIIPTVVWVFGWIFFGFFILHVFLEGVRGYKKGLNQIEQNKK